MSREFSLVRSQTIARPLDEVFVYFADAQNLAALTPEWLKLEILTPAPIEMAAGTTIDYRIKLRGIPLHWRSEITAWEPPYRFVDVQRRGPYSFWIHEHSFEALDDKTTRVKDRVRYGVPGGSLVHSLIVAPDLEKVFNFRPRKLFDVFHGAEAN
jgi:ligand-binding SRPBCC domain-containing protein